MGNESNSEIEGDAFPAQAGVLRWVDFGALAAVIAAAVVFRFWTTSPMWLDEALTIHIAQQPLSHIPAALRHDGHPPLYYVLLHFWMQLVGTSNTAVRALSGIFGVLTIPVMWHVGKRTGGRTVAWCAVVFVAVAPFAVRYSTENRMYSLIMLLVPLAWLCADSLRTRPRFLPAFGLTLCTSALLWSQYWALWLGGTAAVVASSALVRAYWRKDRQEQKAMALILGALVLGALSFVPWLPSLLYQQAHTGTPWGSRSMPQSVLVMTVESIGGPTNSTGQLGGWILCLIMLVGVFGVESNRGRLVLDLRIQPRVRPLLLLGGGTLLLGTVVSFTTNAAFQARYNAVWIPFLFIIAGFGIAMFQGKYLLRGALCVVVLASSYGLIQNVKTPRTQAQVLANEIAANGKPGDVVAVCPDQLGPSLVRVLPPGFQVGSFPTFSDPRTVDWVDYVARNNAVSPEQFGRRLLQHAGDTQQIFFVWSDRYSTHKSSCNEVVQYLAKQRPKNRLLVAESNRYFEKANLEVFWSERP